MSNNTLKHYENIALSDANMFNLLDGKANIVLYPNLLNYKDIDELLGPYGMCVLLFMATKNYGHWVGIFKHNNHTVSFFNSYGGYPDDSLKYIPYHFAKVNNEDVPYLSILLDKSPYDLTYNEYKYQKRDSNIRTCGRHVAVRLFCRSMSDDEYHEYIKHFTEKFNINADEMVTLLTMDI
jgi:hypothetical protein